LHTKATHPKYVLMCDKYEHCRQENNWLSFVLFFDKSYTN
jgi:hypothetical protein